MASLHQQYPDDREAAIFYALALNATALPTDKTLANQKKAAAILEPIFAEQPNHPGVAHYLIHSDDLPSLAEAGLAAARRYAMIAPSVPHALHMPSHIFTRLGYWQELIDTNLRSIAAGQAYAKKMFGEGVAWDQSLHAMDYLAYAYLQLGEDGKARAVVDEIMAFKRVTPDTLPAAYAMAAIPARYAVERRNWAEAAKLELPPAKVAWDKFPWTAAMITFARALGDAHTDNPAGARTEIDKLAATRDALLKAENKYWSDQVEAQRSAAAAILAQAEGRHDEAVRELRAAADLEDFDEQASGDARQHRAAARTSGRSPPRNRTAGRRSGGIQALARRRPQPVPQPLRRREGSRRRRRPCRRQGLFPATRPPRQQGRRRPSRDRRGDRLSGAISGNAG